MELKFPQPVLLGSLLTWQFPSLCKPEGGYLESPYKPKLLPRPPKGSQKWNPLQYEPITTLGKTKGLLGGSIFWIL